MCRCRGDSFKSAAVTLGRRFLAIPPPAFPFKYKIFIPVSNSMAQRKRARLMTLRSLDQNQVLFHEVMVHNTSVSDTAIKKHVEVRFLYKTLISFLWQTLLSFGRRVWRLTMSFATPPPVDPNGACLDEAQIESTPQHFNVEN